LAFPVIDNFQAEHCTFIHVDEQSAQLKKKRQSDTFSKQRALSGEVKSGLNSRCVIN
tara:strand:- start:13920 stop:14090 length:171 start_codon:yes stop_codon:yes gene_type:complete